jgi:hypothetical protein
MEPDFFSRETQERLLRDQDEKIAEAYLFGVWTMMAHNFSVPAVPIFSGNEPKRKRA